MRHLLFVLPFLTLQAQEPELPALLAKAQRLSTDQVLTLQARLAAEPAPGQKEYHELYLSYVLASRRGQSDPKGSRLAVERALRTLEGTRDPERLALQGAFCGLMIGFSSGSAMTLGPKALALFDQAPGNPRALVFKGVHLLHTPAFFGGGSKAAIPVLEEAASAAQKEAPSKDPWAPAWGRVESLSWLAYAQAEAGQPDAARATVARALALDPVNGFIQTMVLPRLKDAH
jgi:hypothetical protein